MKIRLIESPLAIPKYRQVRLPTVAAEFAPHADVEINDENVEPLDLSDADLIGFTAQAYNASRAIHLSGKFRARGIPTMVGGPYASAMGAKALAHFDAVVVGEVEGLGEKILRDAEAGDLRGIYRSARPPENWGARIPRRDLQKAGKYYRINFPVEFTRGCPHRCSFCFGPYLHPTFRTRSLESIAAQIEQWDHGFIEAVDLHCAANRKFIIDVCRLMTEMGVGGWYGEATLQSLDDDEVLKHMALSHCVQMFVGMESIEADVLAGANKGFNRIADYRRIVRKIQDHGIFVHAGLMWGLDGQTFASADLTADFCEEIGVYLASPNIACYFPGTDAFENYKKEGRLLTEDPGDFDSCRVVVEPRGMNAREVYAGARRFVKQFYSYRSIFVRSFQPGIHRLSHLIDYWGFNLIYRAYLRRWSRRLGRRKTPWPGAGEEKRSFPFVGGRMPLIYGVADMEARLFDFGYRAWHRIPGPVSWKRLYPALILILAASVYGHFRIQDLAASHWPVAWPPARAGIAMFACASILSAWLTALIAGVRAPDKTPGPGMTPPDGPSLFTYARKKEPVEPRPAPGRSGLDRLRRLSGLAPVLMAASPMIASVYAVPPEFGAWRFITAFLTMVFLLKAWSVLRSDRVKWKNTYRIGAFLLLFPTLDFDRAFIIDPARRNLLRHFPLMVKGLVKMAVAVPVFLLVFYMTVRFPDPFASGPAGAAPKLLLMYLLLSGLLEYLTAYWRMAGYGIPEPFGPAPFGPALPSRIWKHWNVPFGTWLAKYIYRPPGGRERSPAATFMTFFASGVITALILTPVAGRFPMAVVLFFLANGGVVILEKALPGREAGKRFRMWAFYILSILVFLGTAPWLFEAMDAIFM